MIELEPNDHDWFVEETVPDGEGDHYYRVIYIGQNITECCEFMLKAQTTNKLECWNKLFSECDHGFAPIAWRDEGQPKVMRRMAAIFN